MGTTGCGSNSCTKMVPWQREPKTRPCGEPHPNVPNCFKVHFTAPRVRLKTMWEIRMDEILHHPRSPAMILFPCKYQQAMVSAMVSKWCEGISQPYSMGFNKSSFRVLSAPRRPPRGRRSWRRSGGSRWTPTPPLLGVGFQGKPEEDTNHFGGFPAIFKTNPEMRFWLAWIGADTRLFDSFRAGREL